MKNKFPKFTLSLSFILTVLLTTTQISLAQNGNPPIPTELMFGHKRLDFQLVFKRNFTPTSKFSLLAISVFSENYNNENELGNNLVIPIQVNYSIGKKGIAISTGVEANSKAGFSPTVGFQHVFSNRKVLTLTVVNFFLNEGQDAKIFGLYEFKPPLNEAWSIYSRIQFVYNRSLGESNHNRSFIYLRGGLKKGPLSFGLGANWDAYGPFKETANNFGIFTKWDF
ncbi:hypothetical protein [Algoriphagus halophilus]|uniref:MetA-pathway of phenol degradation n=1 Tax=Algoriphagus halophilus TaxID=226505 RepID=A0A1N6G6H5_9BACT|nr:hypothetical protein [Algoriphagus halophilus]SIO03012.1 hypothetical protein SAMN05444394_3001 [Algoriphagus halophilus]